jgi:HEAT repeat protein
MSFVDLKKVCWAVVLICGYLCITGERQVRATGQNTQQESSARQTESPKVREARELGKPYELKNTQRLLKLLKDQDERVRAAAADGLGLALSDYGNPDGQWMSADLPTQWFKQEFHHKIIAPFEVAGYRAALINALGDPSPRVRVAAVRALAEIFSGGHGPDDVNRAVVPLLKDPDEQVVSAAVSAVPTLRDLDAVPSLITLLQHPSHEVRKTAASALMNMPDRRAIAPLLRSLKDPDPLVRGQVAWALALACYGGLTDPSMREPLLDALQDRQTRAGAVRCLMLANDPGTAEPVYFVLKNDFAQDPAKLANLFMNDINRLIKFLNKDRVADLLLLYAKEPAAESRAIATQRLGAIQDSRAIPALAEASRDPDLEIRRAAANGLVATSDPQAIPVLICMLNESNDEVVVEVVRALGFKGGEQSVQPIIALLHHKSGQVRPEAIMALVKFKTPAADDALLEVLRDSSSTTNDRDWAAIRLCEAGDRRALSDMQALYQEKQKTIGPGFAGPSLESCIQRLSTQPHN